MGEKGVLSQRGVFGISFCRGSSFEVVEDSHKGFIVKLVVWGEIWQEEKKAPKRFSVTLLQGFKGFKLLKPITRTSPDLTPE